MIFQAAAQNKLQLESDRLEQAMLSDKNDTSQIRKLGEKLLLLAHTKGQKFQAFEKISEIYFKANQVNKSIEFLFKAKDIAEEMDDAELLARAYGSISNQYSYLNLTKKAKPYLNKAIDQIEKLPPGDNKYTLKALSYIELGNLDSNDQKFKDANANYRKSLEQFGYIKNLNEKTTYHYRRSLYNIGNSYYYLNQPDSAESYLKKALAINDPKSPSLKYYIYSTLAEVYTFEKKHRRAIDTLQAILNDHDFTINSLKSEIYLNLSKNYKSIGDQAQYALYNEKYLKLRAELEGSHLKAISTAFDAEEKEFKSSISDSDKKNKWLLILILAVILGSSASIFMLIRKKKKEEQIYESIIRKLENPDNSGLPKTEEPFTDTNQPNHLIPPAVEEKILAKLEKFEAAHKFTNQKLTLTGLAVQLKTNNTYVYEIINKHKKKNFNAYINELRINYICNKIYNNPKYLDYKISYLAEISGFTSHSAFATVFKNVTGIAPSVFIKQARKTQHDKSV